MIIKNQVFEKTDVTLDGGVSYEKCTFNACRLLFTGLNGWNLNECMISPDCMWGLSGPAANTLNFLSVLYRMGPAQKAVVEGIIQQIRGGALPPGVSVQTNLPSSTPTPPKGTVN